MKILVVTGRLCEPLVRSSVSEGTDVLVMDLDVAAFITPVMLRQKLKEVNKSYDLILISGLISADFSKLEKEIKTEIRLGPKHAYDLSFLLQFAEEIEFSSTKPACEILKSKMHQNAIREFEKLEKNAKASFLLKNVKIGGTSSMKVMGEIVNAESMKKEALIKKINDFTESGSDIIDIGIGLGSSIKDVKKTVKTALEVSKVPVSIDTHNPELMLIGVELGVEMVLSLNSGSLKAVGKEISGSDVAVVIVPDAKKTLIENIEFAKSLEIKKIISDPVLSPIGHGSIKSLVEYYQFRSCDKDTPLFFGTGNITELIDSDSIGVNAVLAGLAMELDVSILFTPEHSDKTLGSINELKTASKMMQLAKKRKSAPKDVGIDLLVIKEKRRRVKGESVLNYNGKIIWAKENKGWKRDPLGCFIIDIIDKNDGTIRAKHNDFTILGKSAKEVFDTMVDLGLISQVEHAGYLGRELMQAELALRYKRSYVQGDDF